MEDIGYKVAGHFFLIHADCADRIGGLLPSYKPFFYEGREEKPVFELSVGTSLQVGGEEIHRFRWDCSECVVYRKGDAYCFELYPDAVATPYVMCADGGFSNVSVAMRGEPSDAFALNNFLMIAYAFATATLKTLMIHASVVRHAQTGYLFLGKSGTGKSTHSRLWLEHIPGSDLLNDDNPIVRLGDGEAFVYGSPWSGKTPCYRNLSVPVGAFVRLSQAPENRMEKVKPLQGFALVLSSCSVMKWDVHIYNGICDTVSEIVGLVPVFRLDCLPDEAAAHLSFDTLHQQMP